MADHPMSDDAVEAEIPHLRNLDLPGLRARWRTIFRRTAPDHLPRHLLFRILAYRVQAERLGDGSGKNGGPAAGTGAFAVHSFA